MDKYTAAANLALFLTERTGKATGTWKGKMTAKEQRALFGAYVGKGTIVINGADETVSNLVSVCFGQDYDLRNITSWASLGNVKMPTK